MNEAAKQAARIFLSLALAWAAISSLIGRFRHPWMTETQVIMHLPELVLLKTVKEP